VSGEVMASHPGVVLYRGRRSGNHDLRRSAFQKDSQPKPADMEGRSRRRAKPKGLCKCSESSFPHYNDCRDFCKGPQLPPTRWLGW